MPAQRFGGKFSPDNSRPPEADRPFAGQRRSRVGGRVSALFIAPLIFIPTAFFHGALGLATDLAACGVLLAAAWLTREGLLAQDAYDARTVARRPALPRKMIGSVLTGAGLALGSVHPGGSLLAPAIFAVLGAALHFAAFGPDPLSDKGIEGFDAAQTDRVATAIEGAEAYLAAMRAAILGVADRALLEHVDRFAATARKMFRTIEADPRDLTASRRYLGVYLMGARDATVDFAGLYRKTHDPAARTNYEALLSDLEANFAAQTQALLANDKSQLDIQIDVLRERLEQEGVRPAKATP